MQNEFGESNVAVIGMTEVPLAEATTFRKDFQVNYAVLANATASFEKYGISTVWTAPVYLVNPEGEIVGRGFDESEKILRGRG